VSRRSRLRQSSPQLLGSLWGWIAGEARTDILSTASIEKHSDGGGLDLLITGRSYKSQAEGSRILRYTYLKQRYEMGLGSVHPLLLARASTERDRWRDLMNDKRNSVDPMEEKRQLESDAQDGHRSQTGQ